MGSGITRRGKAAVGYVLGMPGLTAERMEEQRYAQINSYWIPLTYGSIAYSGLALIYLLV
jgi:hypothetical protein